MDHRAGREDRQPTILLLGTPHLANHNRDVFNVQFDDMLAPHRQLEIAACVERLARFRPTKVALEIGTAQEKGLNVDYHHYRFGTFPLTADETHQLGFRLAAGLNHPRLYAIDWNEPIGDGRGLDPVFAFAKAHQPELYEQLIGGGQQEERATIATMTVLDLLRDTNAPTSLQISHQVYLTLAQVGADRDYVGVGWVEGWYGRNLRIFVNLTRIIDSSQDRILVIYGSGHIPLLTQFIRDSGLYILEPTERYLG